METLTLEGVLEAFNAPVNEEQAWSVCYQCAKYLTEHWSQDSADCCSFNGVRAVEIGKDGNVTAITGSEGLAHSQYELVQSLGVVVFHALDYGLSDSEEQTLSPGLEALLERMTGSETDDEAGADEGIDAGDDSNGASDRLSLATVMELCSQHLQNPKEAACHYKAVCRALVTEAIELKTFLEKISAEKTILKQHRSRGCDDSTDGLSELDDLERADWARLWMQIMRQLRYGAKLKKVEQVNAQQQPLEFELTPYEILMEDIRSRRYTLNKVEATEFAPRMKKNAHEIILEFIRSRPPLQSAKDRKMADRPPREEDPREMLLHAIRSTERNKLRPTPGLVVETSRTKLSEEEDTPSATRKVIKADLNLLLTDDEDDLDDFDYDDDELEDRNKVTPSPLDPLTPLSPPSSTTAPWQHVARDPIYRNSFNVCPPVHVPMFGPTMSDPRSLDLFSAAQLPHQQNLQSSLECLSLTIEEVMHIRRVLTKAELECLIVNPELYELVCKAKVCFTCKTTRFSLFGQWSTKCRFCKRSVCSKCFSKMRIPTEHFEHIPVYTLSPSPIGSETEDHFVCEKTGSVPSSPNPPQRHVSQPPDIMNNNGRHSRPGRPPLQRARTIAKPLLSRPLIQGPLMNVCRDCKAMIVSIIRSSRSSLAMAPLTPHDFPDCPSRRASRNFHLDLKPVYK